MSDSYLTSLLGKNEQVLRVARRHWLVLAGEIAPEAALSISLIVLVTLLLPLLPAAPQIAWGYALLLFPLLSLTRDVLVWRSHVYVITGRRVMQLSGVFSKNVIDSSLEKVNDVKMEQSALGRLLGYGDVEILTASEMGVNKFTRLADPVGFKTAMLNAREQTETPARPPGRPASTAAGAPSADAAGLLGSLDELRRHGVLTEAEFEAKKKDLLARM